MMEHGNCHRSLHKNEKLRMIAKENEITVYEMKWAMGDGSAIAVRKEANQQWNENDHSHCSSSCNDPMNKWMNEFLIDPRPIVIIISMMSMLIANLLFIIMFIFMFMVHVDVDHYHITITITITITIWWWWLMMIDDSFIYYLR